MCLIVREARISDLESLYKIEIECFGSDAFTKNQLAYFLSSPEFVNLVAETDGIIVGFIIGSIRHYNNQRIGHILSLDISKRYRRRKIGSRLLNELEKIYIQKRVEICYLEVRADNTAALNLYRKFRFDIVGHLRNYYGIGVHGLRLKKTLRQVH